MKILVAEDEFLPAAHLRAVLTNAGHTVLGPVATARDCVELARSGAPDVLLLDIRLAGQDDGIVAGERIREFSDLPLILMSGYQESMLHGRAEGLKPLAYLVKPVLLKDLEAILARIQPREG